jgi:hypothetical protein
VFEEANAEPEEIDPFNLACYEAQLANLQLPKAHLTRATMTDKKY